MKIACRRVAFLVLFKFRSVVWTSCARFYINGCYILWNNIDSLMMLLERWIIIVRHLQEYIISRMIIFLIVIVLVLSSKIYWIFLLYSIYLYQRFVLLIILLMLIVIWLLLREFRSPTIALKVTAIAEYCAFLFWSFYNNEVLSWFLLNDHFLLRLLVFSFEICM